MERLTTHKNECNREMICRYEDCDVCEEYCPHMQEDNCSCLQEVLEKLGQYEDAEEQGLLIKLPCKVGDKVYTNLSSSGWYFRSNDRPYPAKVVFIGLNNSEESGGGFINVSFDKKAGCMMQFRFCDIGNLVFLTKEEAEKKLASMQKGE